MAGRNLNGKYSICSVEIEEGGDVFQYKTLVWGYDTEEQAIAEVDKVAAERGILLGDIAVIGAFFPTAPD